jgi:hypothetical protein
VPHENTVTEGMGDADGNIVALSEVKRVDYSQIGLRIGTSEGGRWRWLECLTPTAHRGLRANPR